MPEHTHEDILNEYIESLKNGTAFDWDAVPDDPELLAALKMARGLWTESHAGVRPEWRSETRNALGEQPATALNWFVAHKWRYAAAGVLGVLVVAVLVGGARGTRPGQVATRINRILTGSGSTSEQVDANTNSNVNDSSFAATNANINTGTNGNTNSGTGSNTNDSMGMTGGAGGEDVVRTATLDVSDLDPNNNMDTLFADFTSDLDDIVTDLEDDGLANMASDIQLVDL